MESNVTNLCYGTTTQKKYKVRLQYIIQKIHMYGVRNHDYNDINGFPIFVTYRVEHNYLPVTLNQFCTLVVHDFKIIFHGI